MSLLCSTDTLREEADCISCDGYVTTGRRLEDAADEIDQLAAENEKLRALVRDMAVVICVYDQCVTVDDCPPALPMFTDKMRELGIELDA